MGFSLLLASCCNPVVPGRIVLGKFLILCLGDGSGECGWHKCRGVRWQWFGKRCVPTAFHDVFRLCWFRRKKGGEMFLGRFSCLNRKPRGKRIQIRIGMDAALESKYNSLPQTKWLSILSGEMCENPLS
jgi:hypothetical protein